MTRRELLNASVAAVPVTAAPVSIRAENLKPGATDWQLTRVQIGRAHV